MFKESLRELNYWFHVTCDETGDFIDCFISLFGNHNDGGKRFK